LELELRARVGEPHDDAPAARGEANGIGAEVNHELVESFLVAEVREMRSVALALQDNPRLFGLRVKFLDDAVHQPCKIERRHQTRRGRQVWRRACRIRPKLLAVDLVTATRELSEEGTRASGRGASSE
jgi:hypothetical protein